MGQAFQRPDYFLLADLHVRNESPVLYGEFVAESTRI